MIAAVDLTLDYRLGPRRRVLRALDGLTLEVPEGEFFALVGPNGAGKSTFVHCLLGLLRPTRGRVSVMGQAPGPGARLFADMAYLPEEPHYHGYLTVAEALDYYGRLLPRHPPRDAVQALVERFGLTGSMALRVDRCSKGMKQKVGIVACLMGEPRLLVLDEPMRGLDPSGVRLLRDALVEAHRRGVTIVMNSHMLGEVEMVATRVAVLQRGRVIADGALRDLLTVDPNQYVIECDRVVDLPAYFAAEACADGAARGTVPAERLHDFMNFMQGSGGRVTSCVLRRATLEESFLALTEPPRA